MASDDTWGRNESFAQGTADVRRPSFTPIRPIAFHPTSVLHPIANSDNGLGMRDYSRRLMGLQQSSVGQSDQTFDANAQIRFPFIKTFG